MNLQSSLQAPIELRPQRPVAHYTRLGWLIVVLGVVHAYFGPRWRRGIELAERDLAGGGELSDEFKANSRQMAIAGMLISLLVLVTIFFMVVKP